VPKNLDELLKGLTLVRREKITARAREIVNIGETLVPQSSRSFAHISTHGIAHESLKALPNGDDPCIRSAGVGCSNPLAPTTDLI
jgi:hypothetical protein